MLRQTLAPRREAEVKARRNDVHVVNVPAPAVRSGDVDIVNVPQADGSAVPDLLHPDREREKRKESEKRAEEKETEMSLRAER